MKKAQASIYLDKTRPKKNGTCSVKIKITFNRKRKYFATGINLTLEEFNQVMFNQRRNSKQKELQTKLDYLRLKAERVIDDLKVFSFNAFEDAFLEERNTHNTVAFAFDRYIEDLELEERLNTASSYRCAKNSLEKFDKNLTFADVTSRMLKQYQKWMTDNNKSITTVGIYLRSLRAVYNLQNIDKSLYPFGESKGKYSIPTSKNIKKALSMEELRRLYNYDAPKLSRMDQAKDYWFFLYLCNGINVKDFCLLKWSDINGDILTYTRSKTKNTKRERKQIQVSLKKETKAIIKKWGQPSISKDAFIFPHLTEGMNAKKQKLVNQLVTQMINKYVKQIAKEVGVEKQVTSYWARHSFATVLKRSGSSKEMIGELLGHSSTNTTEKYLASFESDAVKEQTDVLTSGLKNVN